MLKIGQRQIDAIERHAAREYPHECCGLLVGRIDDDGRTRVVCETFAVANAWEAGEALTHRMRITPLDYARAEREFAARGLGVVGNYHSHPNHPARPSRFDLEHLAPWATMSYVVVSVTQAGAVDLRSWELEPDRSRFNEEEISRLTEEGVLKGSQP
jgi:proteasome lid subunit RPN8/RPN11